MKVLLLPLFRMPSGHHKAAEAIAGYLSNIKAEIEVKTVDCLSHFHSGIETVISNTYLKWINRKPALYSKFYHSFIYSSNQKKHTSSRFSLCFWDNYLAWRMEKFIEEEQPDVIICTHCYPSKLLNYLKKRGKIHVPVVNVYTDFFMNDIWGKEYIDFHFVPHQEAKEQLIKRYSLKQEQIFVTGIPVHPFFRKPSRSSSEGSILIAGGNSGLGNLKVLIEQLAAAPLQYSYKVLCGHNKKLYEQVQSLQHEKIEAIPYTNCRKQMNQYYDEASAIITKPGGITITEVLEKSLPVFILDRLPGQEEINCHYLKEQHLVYELNMHRPIEQQMIKVISNEVEMNKWHKRLTCYQLEKDDEIENSLLTIFKSKESAYAPSLKKSAWDPYLG
ncbi:MGDG synthase family glycosyltransferase [Bacillus sp. FJAT-27231]|uniref:MGDG synthase family glycosyltransferase n=1 Tax=Bacillus sp. FJAT-27231 TaxID=1679168 RepID=UPI0006709D55|nr:glycosyltransferase [Bacillus sp. FJAT-27231]